MSDKLLSTGTPPRAVGLLLMLLALGSAALVLFGPTSWNASRWAVWLIVAALGVRWAIWPRSNPASPVITRIVGIFLLAVLSFHLISQFVTE